MRPYYERLCRLSEADCKTFGLKYANKSDGAYHAEMDGKMIHQSACERLGKGAPDKKVAKEGPKWISGLPSDRVVEVIHAHNSELKKCLALAFETNPGIRPNLLVNFEIDPMGKVARAAVRGAQSESLENCIQSRFLEWRFPEYPGGNTNVLDYPVRLLQKK